MKKWFVVTQLIVCLLAIVYFRFITIDVNFMSNWGLYFFIVPLVFSFALLFSKKETLLKLLLGVSIGGIITIMLYRGSWTEGFVLLKLLAFISGIALSYVEYFFVKKASFNEQIS